MLSIVELLRLRGLDCDAKVKLVRHQDTRYDLYELMVSGHFETYQSYQAKPVFNCDYIVSFMGMARRKARLIGVYEVGTRCRSKLKPPPDGFPLEIGTGKYHYELKELPGFDDLKERVVIDWGKSTRAWHQWLTDKEVMEVLPEGYARQFPGYLDFLLPFDELSRLCQYPEANREWHTNLQAVAGVYLIVDTLNGFQYVGSAYGSKGIMGRWSEYARTGHGGNKRLMELASSDSDAPKRFQFSVLRTLSKSLTSKEVIEYENFYKQKLGTRAFGLNEN